MLTDLCVNFCSRFYCCKEGPERTLLSLIFVNYPLGLIFVFSVFLYELTFSPVLFCLLFDIQIKNNNLREESSNHALRLHHIMHTYFQNCVCILLV